MKEPTLAIRMAYYQLIKTALPTVSVFDSLVTNDAPAKRIVLGSQTYDGTGGTKDGFGGVAQIDIDIVCRQPIGMGGGKWSDETANAIMEAVSPQRGACALAVTGWKVVTVSAQVVPFAPLEQPTSGDYIHRKIVRFTHEIFES
jgi:hypothetical protein